jgi:hypothetical protein
VALIVPFLQTLCLVVGGQRRVEAWKDEKPLLSVPIMFPIMGLTAHSDFVERYITHRYAFARSNFSPNTKSFLAPLAGKTLTVSHVADLEMKASGGYEFSRLVEFDRKSTYAVTWNGQTEVEVRIGHPRYNGMNRCPCFGVDERTFRRYDQLKD